MWEMRIARPFGRLSVRNLFVFVAGLLAAAFSLAMLSTTPVLAAPDAHWEGTQVSYKDNLYTRDDDGAADDPRGVPENAIVFSYQDETSWPYKIHFIHFTENTDPNTAEQAVYSSATYDPTQPDATAFSDITEDEVITLAVYNDPNANRTSCNQEGIGWIICPLTNWLAKGMDTLYSLISGFLEVRPAQTSPDNPLYKAWSVMRNFANILFMVGFLAIIYSQITSIGLSNFAIKKMLPRLIIAAVLVNISYWICAIAIDASNVLGYSIQDIFINIRENLVGPDGNTWELVNWQSITGAVLAAGAGAAALTVGGIAFVASAGSSIFLLLPILVGVLMAVLVALLIMAARQAIITILLVISPLAFVAFLLPNTEKYFEKWRSLGVTMLLLFPIFSVLFGGAQLAGALIIQNADSINLVILGLATQVAPLVITPFLIKFSGSLLGRIAGIINNPNKGVIDRTRKFAEERAGQMKSRQLAKGNNWLANRARGMNNRRLGREGRQKAHDSMTEANWGKTSKAQEIQQYAMEAAQTKELGDTRAKATYEQAKTGTNANSRIQKLTLDIATAKAETSRAETATEGTIREFEAGNIGHIAVNADAVTRNGLARQAERLRDTVIQTGAEKHRIQSAQNVQAKQLADALQQSQALQTHAGGIDPNGPQRALADALSAQQKIRAQAVDNAKVIINYSNLSDTETVDLALGQSQRGIEATVDVQEAAIKKIASSGNIAELDRLVESLDLTPGSNVDHRTALTEALRTNNARPKFIGFSLMGAMDQGIPGGFGQAGMDEAIRKTATAGKLSADAWVQQDQDAIVRIYQALQRDKDNYSQESLGKLKKEINNAFKHPILSTRIGEREGPLKDILSILEDIPEPDDDI